MMTKTFLFVKRTGTPGRPEVVEMTSAQGEGRGFERLSWVLSDVEQSAHVVEQRIRGNERGLHHLYKKERSADLDSDRLHAKHARSRVDSQIIYDRHALVNLWKDIHALRSAERGLNHTSVAEAQRKIEDLVGAEPEAFDERPMCEGSGCTSRKIYYQKHKLCRSCYDRRRYQARKEELEDLSGVVVYTREV